jgi:hypothetical protein
MAHYRGQPGNLVVPTEEKRTVRMTSWRGTGADERRLLITEQQAARHSKGVALTP